MNIEIIRHEDDSRTVYSDADLSLPQVVTGFMPNNTIKPPVHIGDILMQADSARFEGVRIVSGDLEECVNLFRLSRQEAQRVFVEPFKGRIVMEF